MSNVVIGAGVIGSRVARLLAERGEQVIVVSRSGSGPTDTTRAADTRLADVTRAADVTRVADTRLADVTQAAGVTRVAADARDAEAMTRLTAGAAVIYNCVNPPYHRWPADWPPIAASVLDAAERSGAVLVTLSNLYGYGPAAGGYTVSHPMTEETPLAATGRKGQVRARMWQEALAAHRAGRVRATEVRAADFVGPAAQSALGERVVRRVRQGKSVSVLGRADRLHTWSFTGDVAAMLVTAGTDPRAWGRAWHVPSDEARTQREVVSDLGAAAGTGQVRVSTLPPTVLAGMGLVWPLMRELRETEYQFRDDFIMDSSAAQATFGLKPTPWEEVVAATVFG